VLILSNQIQGLEDDVNLRTITILWQESLSDQHKIYSVTVEPAIQECNTTCETEEPEMELRLAIHTAYKVTSKVVMCKGNLNSTESKPLQVFLNGMILHVTQCTYIE